MADVEINTTKMREALRLCVDALNESDPIHDDYWAAAKAGEDALAEASGDRSDDISPLQRALRAEAEVKSLRLANSELATSHNYYRDRCSELESSRPATRDIGVVGPVDGMNNPSAEGPYFRVVLIKGDNQHRSEYLISRGAAENLRDELRALLAPPLVFDDGPTAA